MVRCQGILGRFRASGIHPGNHRGLGKGHGCKTAVITGGEPCMYELDGLTARLRQEGIATYLETSGAYTISGTWDWICVSPKKFKPVLPASLAKANELKVVVFNRHDLSWAQEQASGTSAGTRLFLQPEYSVRDKVLPEIIAFVKRHLNGRFPANAQVHADSPDGLLKIGSFEQSTGWAWQYL